jgi:hypothetical protein
LLIDHRLIESQSYRLVRLVVGDFDVQEQLIRRYVLSSFPLLHGAGGAFDELPLYLGIAAVLIVLACLSWKATKNKDQRRRDRKSKRIRR